MCLDIFMHVLKFIKVDFVSCVDFVVVINFNLR